MKAYVLVNPKNNRLVDDKITTYPTVLPEYTVVYGKTVDDIPTHPDWYKEYFGCDSNKVRSRGYCACISHLNAITELHEKYPDEDILILEDDVEFESDFNEYYKSFMDMVPSDWDIIYFGGWHRDRPHEIVDNVLRCKRIYGIECALLNNRFVKELVRTYKQDSTVFVYQLDVMFTVWSCGDVIKVYAPIFPFAHQRVTNSGLYDKPRYDSSIVYCMYIDINGNETRNKRSDLARYFSESNIK